MPLTAVRQQLIRQWPRFISGSSPRLRNRKSNGFDCKDRISSDLPKSNRGFPFDVHLSDSLSRGRTYPGGTRGCIRRPACRHANGLFEIPASHCRNMARGPTGSGRAALLTARRNALETYSSCARQFEILEAVKSTAAIAEHSPSDNEA